VGTLRILSLQGFALMAGGVIINGVPPPQILVPLWPGRVHPAMRVVIPGGAHARPRPAMLVFRGGAYARSDGSGDGSAEWAAAHGMVGIEVEYATRSSGEAHPRSYADAARAVRLVRAHAAEWGIDPHRVGVMGYSAGGHLASLLSTQPRLWIDPEDDLSRTHSARPDLVVLAYPLISFVDGYRPGAFLSSVESFFGRRDVDEQTRRRFSSELHVEPSHPPVFIWTTEDDTLVPYTHSTAFADACRRAHIQVELLLFAKGGHGMGLALDQPAPARQWTARLLDWLRDRWGPL
jgi:acetyl esterase/lipase